GGSQFAVRASHFDSVAGETPAAPPGTPDAFRHWPERPRSDVLPPRRTPVRRPQGAGSGALHHPGRFRHGPPSHEPPPVESLRRRRSTPRSDRGGWHAGRGAPAGRSAGGESIGTIRHDIDRRPSLMTPVRLSLATCLVLTGMAATAPAADKPNV